MQDNFWFKLLRKTFIALGIGYFSIAVGTQDFSNFIGPLAAAGLYFFIELGRHYRVNTFNTTQKSKHKKTKQIQFLI